MNIVIPIGKRRFYYNRKINCLLQGPSVRRHARGSSARGGAAR
jgi:hypothetical protein